MLRINTPPRLDWPKLVEAQGLLFHSIDGVPYWDESAYYLFESREVDAIEQATVELDRMCLAAVEHVITNRRLDVVGVPPAFHRFVAESWERDEHTIYGRFDLSYDGSGPPRLLEYNADTPTSLLEASVIQWFWAEAMRAAVDDRMLKQFDQFNSIHERLIEAWQRVARELGTRIAFASLDNTLEDNMTAAYLRDTAIQGGMQTEAIAVEQIGWNANRRVFTDVRERAIPILFKLYPWEWMLGEEFGRHLLEAPTHFLEPPWKMVLSSKGILPILSELFPGSPYLLPTGFEPLGSSYVAKPTHSREGANVTIVQNDQIIAETGGDYGEGPWVYQQYHPLPNLDGHFPVVGSWIINGHACGMGIREDDGPITQNTSRFIPHLFRKSTTTKPPVLPANYQAGRPAEADPLWTGGWTGEGGSVPCCPRPRPLGSSSPLVAVSPEPPANDGRGAGDGVRPGLESAPRGDPTPGGGRGPCPGRSGVVRRPDRRAGTSLAAPPALGPGVDPPVGGRRAFPGSCLGYLSRRDGGPR